MPLTAVTVTYLEILDPREIRPKRSPRTDLALVRIDPPIPEFNRFFYTTVGASWFWINRLAWTYQQWADYVNRPELVETWMLTAKGVPAGYFELEAQPERNVEVAYFGLLPQFVGAGLGGHLLTCALERGFAMGAARVWLHTCTLDHPQAIANYKARGMRQFKQETNDEDVPEKSPGPWPGAIP